MVTKVFDRDTLLDLTVNFIPLFILLFFAVGYVLYNPFDLGPTGRIIQYVILGSFFVLLTILTYLSGKAIETAEKTGPVYPPGAATVDDAEPIEHDEPE